MVVSEPGPGAAFPPSADQVSAISIDGLARNNDGLHLRLTVPRASSQPPRIRDGTIIYDPDASSSKEQHDDDACADPEEHVEPGGVCPYSSAPVLAHTPRQDSGIHLLLRLGERLHTGKNAWVYAMEVLDPPTPLPPLVAKIARPTKGRTLRLSAEAGAYDVLRGLQGQIVPRCYGHFRCAVNLQEMTIVPWDPDCELPRSRADLDVCDTPDPGCASLDILLLERLGKRLQDYGLVELPAQDDLREDLLDMLMAAADLGIRHTDVSASNILEAAASEPEPPGAAAAAAEATRVPGFSASRPSGGYRWRIVDWEEYADTPRDDPRWFVEERFEDEIEHIFQHSLNLHSDVLWDGGT